MKFHTTIPLLLAAGVFVSACGGGTSSSSTDDNSSYDTVDTSLEDDQVAGDGTSPSGSAIPDGARLLASQCFQCHGTDGHSQTDIDSLAGESEAELIEEMQEMVSESDHELMHFQARGYTDEQVRAIAAYISSLPNSGNGDNDDYEEEHDD